VKNGVSPIMRKAAYELCLRAPEGASAGVLSLSVVDVRPSDWWLIQTVNTPNPHLAVKAKYSMTRQHCKCDMNFNFAANWLDKADMHWRFFPDMVLIPFGYIGIGQEYLIDIDWKASGSAQIYVVPYIAATVFHGWPFE
jgi:hypothetical protein